MWKPLLETISGGLKVAGVMYLAILSMRAAVHLGATPLEAGCSVIVAAVLVSALLLSRVIGAAGDSFHPKVDELIADLGDIRRRGE
jgi:hypothetical protein